MSGPLWCRYQALDIQGDQKVSVNLMTTIQLSDAQRLFNHPVYLMSLCYFTFIRLVDLILIHYVL